MQELNEYLQQLVSKSGSELYLEPNKQPFVVTPSGNATVSNNTLAGAKINTMIFALIPNDVKKQLPNNSKVEFVHPHNLGNFNFVVKKSPSGFIVTVSPLQQNSVTQEATQQNTFSQEQNPQAKPITPTQNLQTEEPILEQFDSPKFAATQPQSNKTNDDLIVEINSPPQEKNEFLNETSIQNDLLSTSDYAFESNGTPTIKEYLPELETNEVSSQVISTNETPVLKANKPYSAEEISIQDQVYEVEQLEIQIENPVSEVENTENTINNMKPQNQTPFNSQPVVNNPTPKVKQQIPNNGHSFAQNTEIASPTPQTPVSQPVTSAKVSASVSAPNPQAKKKMDSLFHKMNEVGASDLHMSVSVPPMVRKDGKMAKLDDRLPNLTEASIKQLLESIMPQKNIQEFAERNDTDFAYEIEGLARFRANIFMDRKGMGGVFRIIPSEILTAEKLGLSKHIMDLCDLSKGLVVVTGPTGSGKSTTLCAMVDAINKKREDHIITIEDPIEFTHENHKCLVNQREVHNHTDSFKDALRAALREDPDILLVGEMRDLETISIAIETAETGHLVFGTLHTTTAASTVDRIIAQFPADRQQQVRVMLSESLRGVIAQTLLPKIGGGRIAALEVLIVTPAISNLIREGKTFQIPSAMQTGKNKGMVMLNDALIDLVNKGLVEAKDAYIKSVDKEGFELLLKRNGKRI